MSPSSPIIENEAAPRKPPPAAASPEAGADVDTNQEGLFGQSVPLLNLITMIGAGVVVLWWVAHFTELYEEIGGAIALTGTLSWFAFLLKLFPENEFGKLQGNVYDAVFRRKATIVLLAILLVALCVIGSFYGSIQLEPLGESTDRRVWVEKVQEPGKSAFATHSIDEAFERLAIGGRVRWPVRLDWSGAKFIVQASGYPDKLVSVRPFKRVDLYVPASFLRPVVLLLPTRNLIHTIANDSMTIEVIAGGLTNRQIFDGHALWIGCNAEVRVPESVQEIWKGKLSPDLMHYWLDPQPMHSPRHELHEGDPIEVCFRRKDDNGIFLQKKFTVLGVPDQREFRPQIEEVDVPKD